MTDAEILQEIEKRLTQWLEKPGWAEENPGFAKVHDWIKYLRAFDRKPD